MDNLHMEELETPLYQNGLNLKTYRCPHCQRFLFKGNVQKLNMVCHHCQKMISADDNELMMSEEINIF